MFPPIKSEIDARFKGVEDFFRSTSKWRGSLGLVAKGLVFVQVYAIYEYTVRTVVRTAIDSINAQRTKLKNFSPSLLALYLDPELSSLKDAGKKNLWAARLKIFQRAFSEDIVNLSSGVGPPHDGSHYRHTNLLMIFEVFGIKRSPAKRRRHLVKIDEVVNNRNQISHGNDTAEDIGRRYTRPEIMLIIRQMKSVCHLLISAFDVYCADKSAHKRK